MLAPVGHCLNRHRSLTKTTRTVIKRHGIPNTELIRTYLGLITLGQSDFEAASPDWLWDDPSLELLQSSGAPISPLKMGHVALNMDAFPVDNSHTSKEGVSYSYTRGITSMRRYATRPNIVA